MMPAVIRSAVLLRLCKVFMAAQFQTKKTLPSPAAAEIMVCCLFVVMAQTASLTVLRLIYKTAALFLLTVKILMVWPLIMAVVLITPAQSQWRRSERELCIIPVLSTTTALFLCKKAASDCL